jgi:hypothetical protein
MLYSQLTSGRNFVPLNFRLKKKLSKFHIHKNVFKKYNVKVKFNLYKGFYDVNSTEVQGNMTNIAYVVGMNN